MQGYAKKIAISVLLVLHSTPTLFAMNDCTDEHQLIPLLAAFSSGVLCMGTAFYCCYCRSHKVERAGYLRRIRQDVLNIEQERKTYIGKWGNNLQEILAAVNSIAPERDAEGESATERQMREALEDLAWDIAAKNASLHKE